MKSGEGSKCKEQIPTCTEYWYCHKERQEKKIQVRRENRLMFTVHSWNTKTPKTKTKSTC